MLAAVIALALLAAAVGAIYLLLRNMGEDGIEVAAPTSCKSGQCGVRKGGSCSQDASGEPVELALADDEFPPQDDAGPSTRPQKLTG